MVRCWGAGLGMLGMVRCCTEALGALCGAGAEMSGRLMDRCGRAGGSAAIWAMSESTVSTGWGIVVSTGATGGVACVRSTAAVISNACVPPRTGFSSDAAASGTSPAATSTSSAPSETDASSPASISACGSSPSSDADSASSSSGSSSTEPSSSPSSSTTACATVSSMGSNVEVASMGSTGSSSLTSSSSSSSDPSWSSRIS